MKTILLALVFVLPVYCFCQHEPGENKEIIKQGISGSVFKVPKGKQWEFVSLSVSAGSYPVQVGSVKYDSVLNSNDSIVIPFWVAEAELLDGNTTNNMFTLKVREIESKQ